MRRFLAIALWLGLAVPAGAQSQPYLSGTTTLPMNAAAALAGQAFFAGSTATLFALAGNLRYTISNPAGSGVNCTAYELHASSNLATFAHFWENPTTVPTTARTVNNLLLGAGNANHCIVKADSGVGMAGGVDTGDDLGLPNGILDLQGQTMIVPPGMTLGVNVPVTGAATIAITLFWTERAIGSQ